MRQYLFLDDLRNPDEVTWVNMPREVDWVIVRSYNEAVNWVKEYGWPDFVAFDHDLGDISGPHVERTGYHFAEFLIDYALDGNTMPDGFRYIVHSMNTIGARRITQLLDNYIGFVNR